MDKDRVTISYSEMKPMSHLDIGEFPEDGTSVGRSKSPSLAGSNDDLTSGLLYERPRIQHGLNGRLAFAIASVALGSAFQHGYNTGVVNAPQALIEGFINSTNYDRTGEGLTDPEVKMIWSWAVSIFCIGGMVGGSMTGYLSTRLGRKGGLLINNVFAFIAAALEGFSKLGHSYEMIIAGRFFIGVNSGINAGLAVMYLTEISPVHLRGAAGTVYQLVITISILASQVLGIQSVLGTEDRWPLLLSLTVVAAIFQLCTLPLCPESPKFILINQGKEVEAQKALTWLRESVEVIDEMEEIRNEYESGKLVPSVTMREMFTNPSLRFPLIISLMMMLAQQLSGINCAIFFSTQIFLSAGLTTSQSEYATIGMGAMNVLMTIVSLVLVERAGRKTLMLTGLIGMFICTILLTICLILKDEVPALRYCAILLVIGFVVMFATGPGSIPWFLVTELFAQGARPLATAIAVTTNWSANFLVGLAFLPLATKMGPYVFLIFSGMLFFFSAFTYKFVPETKNKTIEDITAMFRQRTYNQ